MFQQFDTEVEKLRQLCIQDVLPETEDIYTTEEHPSLSMRDLAGFNLPCIYTRMPRDSYPRRVLCLSLRLIVTIIITIITIINIIIIVVVAIFDVMNAVTVVLFCIDI